MYIVFYIRLFPVYSRKKYLVTYVSYKLICTADGLSTFTAFSVYVSFSRFIYSLVKQINFLRV